LGGGEFGALFESENPTDLAKVIIDLLRNNQKRTELAIAGKEHAQLFDWEVVAEQIFSIYEMSIVGSEGVGLAKDHRSWNRLLTRDGDDK
jgi:phosphatidylinositol alpha-mannosyltransferase